MALPDLSSLWVLSRGEPEICIALLDGPVAHDHPALRGAQLTGDADPALGASPDGPSLRHGTHVASVVFGQPGSPVHGVAPGTRGLIVPIYRDGTDGAIIPCMQDDLAHALLRAVDAGAHIINLSGGQRVIDADQPAASLIEAVRTCHARGVLIVAAAGNDGCRCLHVPAALPSVLAIGALDDRGAPMASSNWGDAYREHGLLVPGEHIAGAVPGGGTAMRSGTSYATAIASGIVALLLGIARRCRPDTSPGDIRDALLATARPCDPAGATPCERFLAGSLDLAGALAAITRHRANELPIEGDLRMQEDHAEPARSTSSITTPPIITHPIPTSITAPGDAVLPSGAGGGCGCGSAGATAEGKPVSPALVYTLGVVGYDFRSQARLESITQDATQVLGIAAWNPHDPRQLLAYLDKAPWEASSLIWTLRQEETPIYAIVPGGAFGAETFLRLREFLKSQVDDGVERVSIPGVAAGYAKLMSGQTVPVIVPTLRGMFSWSTPVLVTQAVGKRPSDEAAAAEHGRKLDGVRNFLDRVYYELRNLGISSQERAINYAATNAFQASAIFAQAVRETLELDSIQVEKSPLCRDGSECFDVKLSFFDPERQHQRARRQYRFTIDVSDVVPVTIGRTRSWAQY